MLLNAVQFNLLPSDSIQRKLCIILNSAALSNTAQYWDKETSAGTAAPPRGELDILDMEQLINIRDLNTRNMS